MRAFLLESLDGPAALRLGDVPEPVPDDASVVLDVRAVGINFPDLLATKGQYQNTTPLPFVPGCEIAGTVRSAPAGSGWSPGDRAVAFVWDGGYAERARVPLNSIAPFPAGADFATGTGMVVNAQTALFALDHRGGLQDGETLLVLGAGGGIGTAAVQVGKGMGARVIAGVASEEQRVTATTAGADEVIVLADGFAASVRELSEGRGVDVVLDPLGDWLFEEATRALAPDGRILVVGFAAGDIPTVRLNRLLLKNISAVGVAWGAFLSVDEGAMRRLAATLNTLHDRGVLRPVIDRHYRFEEIPEALGALDAHQIRGKAVAILDNETAR